MHVPRHQLSYTLAALHAGDQPASGGGWGDVLLNYRYQLLGNGRAKVAFAPRFSVLLSTGDYRPGRGAGGTGIQGLLPLSVVLNRKLVTHWNAGTTIIPNARNTAGETGTTFAYNFGQSVVWLAHPRFNVLLETVFNRSQEVTRPKTTQWTSDLLLNPGIRWAYNCKKRTSNRSWCRRTVRSRTEQRRKKASSFTSAWNIPTGSSQKNNKVCRQRFFYPLEAPLRVHVTAEMLRRDEFFDPRSGITSKERRRSGGVVGTEVRSERVR